MLPFHGLLLTFRGIFCTIKRYKGNFGRFLLIGCCAALLCSGCRRAKAPVPTPSPTTEDTAMRGVWVSYIELNEMLAHGDTDAAKTAIVAVMNTCAANRINTIFWHLRAHGDAYFPSTAWPAAKAAKQVMAGGFDPLAYAIAEAHARGIRLHAWINPYRLGDTPAADAVCFQKDGTWYLAPHDPVAQRNIRDGVAEIVQRYDVDGVHFDDYFYPAGMNPAGEPFEPIPAQTDVTAWRQAHVDTLVSGIYRLCHRQGKTFGLSPAADIDRNHRVAYANVTRWMREPGYIDYICPQIYTGFQHQSHPFTTLLDAWTALPRRDDVALYVGLALYKVGLPHDPYAGTGRDEWATDPTILSRQMDLATDRTDGYVLFRYGNLLTNP